MAQRRLVSERLMALFLREVSMIETEARRERTIGRGRPSIPFPEGEKDQTAATVLDGATGSKAPGSKAATAIVAVSKAATARPVKDRIETLGQLTRTFEKLLDLARQEREALGRGGGTNGEGPEAERMRDELVRRLKALEERRLAEIVARAGHAGLSDTGTQADTDAAPVVRRESGDA